MNATLPILTFHAIDNKPSVTSIRPDVFTNAMTKLHERGYKTLDLTDAVEMLKNGIPFGKRSFVITFDDGYSSVYDHAFPVLKDFKMTATVFLTTGKDGNLDCSGRIPDFEGRPMLKWGNVLEMKKWGIRFGGHTLTHSDLTDLSPEDARNEVTLSRNILAEKLGCQARCFAYPYGRYNQTVMSIVKEQFDCACSDKLGFLDKDSNPYALERIETYYLRTNRLFSLATTPFFPWYIRSCNIPRNIRRFFNK